MFHSGPLRCQGARARVEQPARFLKKFSRPFRGFAAVLPRLPRFCPVLAVVLPRVCRGSAAFLSHVSAAPLLRFTNRGEELPPIHREMPCPTRLLRASGCRPRANGKNWPRRTNRLLDRMGSLCPSLPQGGGPRPPSALLDAVRRAVAKFDAGARCHLQVYVADMCPIFCASKVSQQAEHKNSKPQQIADASGEQAADTRQIYFSNLVESCQNRFRRPSAWCLPLGCRC